MIVNVDGAALFYSTRGSGPACLVPTAMGTEFYEQQLPSALSEHLRLVFVDLRGGGQSTGDPHALTFDQIVADFEAVRGDLAEDTVAVLGHSILGILAIEYGRRCRSRVSHVIAVGTPPRGGMDWLLKAATQFFEQDASADRKAVWRDNLATLPPGTPIERSFAAQAPLRFFDARTDIMSVYRDARVNPALLTHLMGPLTSEWDITRDATSLHVPTLLAHGRYDYTVPYTLWDGVEALLPGATRHVFQRSGHQPFFEEPREFTSVVTAWIE